VRTSYGGEGGGGGGGGLSQCVYFSDKEVNISRFCADVFMDGPSQIFSKNRQYMKKEYTESHRRRRRCSCGGNCSLSPAWKLSGQT